VTDRPENWDDRDGWNRFFAAELSAGHPAFHPHFIVLRFRSFVHKKGGRIWFPGCGLDPYPRTYAEQGCHVLATDFSSVAVRYQQQQAAAFLTENEAGTLNATFDVAEQDFTHEAPEGTFDVVINCRAFQGLSSSAMRAAAVHFYAALRPGGAAILDTINVQGSGRREMEDSLMTAGFYIPFQKSESWYRQRLESTGIVYGMVMGRPRIPNWGQYPAEEFSELAGRDQQIIDSFTAEYERRRQEESDEVKATIDNPKTIVAHVVYATG